MEEKDERKPACSSSFDSAGRRGLPSKIFFFFKERDFFFFFLLSSLAGLAQLQTPPASQRERLETGGRGKKKEKKR